MPLKAQTIYGSPGCGKTKRLVDICARHVNNGHRVCVLSFTKAAAKEIRERIDRDTQGKSYVMASTVHSLAFNALGLRRSEIVSDDRLYAFGEATGIPLTGYVDLSSGDERVVEEGDDAMAIINRARANLVSPYDEYDKSSRPLGSGTFKYLKESYDSWKQANFYTDFADMLDRFVESDPMLGYDTLVVDEAQDMSAAQWAVIDALSKSVKNLYIAGDDDQTLFTFIGAQKKGMKSFSNRYSSQRVELTQSYRIPGSVHGVAMTVRDRLMEKDSITYQPRHAVGQVRYFNDIGELYFDDTDTLVLYRTHAMRRGIERQLIDSSVPYKILSGFPAPWDGKYGAAVNAVKRLVDGGTVSIKQKRLLDEMCFTRCINASTRWQNVLDIPPSIMNFMCDTEGKDSHIRLTTIHGSKGLEADRVVLFTGMTERVIDSFQDDPDPEHRVFYVGVTRAKETLDIVSGDRGYSLY